MEQEKPCIKIYKTSDARREWIRALCSGIEEEMIPFVMEDRTGDDTARMAFAAAETSRLEVGVAISGQGAALAYGKLSPEDPLFALSVSEVSEEALQKMGANAARLVKGIAFKE